MNCFICFTVLNSSKQSGIPEFDEHLEIEFYTLDEALQLALSGKIRDAKTLAAVLWKAVQDRG